MKYITIPEPFSDNNQKNEKQPKDDSCLELSAEVESILASIRSEQIEEQKFNEKISRLMERIER